MSIVLNVPHQFQEHLSAEKTPTLCDMLPVFEAVSALLSRAIDAGLEKLSEYTELTHDVPAHMLAMAVNPYIKLNWYSCFWPEEYVSVKQSFVDAVCTYHSSDEVSDGNGDRASDPDPDPTQWVFNALRLDPQRTVARSQQQPVEHEVDLYLMDMSAGSMSLIYWQNLSREAEFRILEALTDDSIVVPSDLTVFRQSLTAVEAVVVAT
ncbi:hypothetical protein IW261DRAFT_1418930 [Armillaria novae-zelandiae]|uniref:Uncharacterized protein n=1 Tax=Armillaria novae-zelandiae TaxID=153914 RepID=A0AA39U8Z2_9AGAR|nr:hypothetical protein IW261DRAFT_1418930 [Armillaria novae-zelandiae]